MIIGPQAACRQWSAVAWSGREFLPILDLEPMMLMMMVFDDDDDDDDDDDNDDNDDDNDDD